MTSIQNIITELKGLVTELDETENFIRELNRLDLNDLKNMRSGIAGSISYIAGGFTGKKYVEKYQLISSEQSKIFSNIDEIKNYIQQLVPWFEKLLTSDENQIKSALTQPNFVFLDILKNMEAKWIEIKKTILNTEKVETTLIRESSELNESFKSINLILNSFNNLKSNSELSSRFKNFIQAYLNSIFVSDKISEAYTYLNGAKVFVDFIINEILNKLNSIKIDEDKIKIFEKLITEIFNNKNVLYYIKDKTSSENIFIKMAQDKKIEVLQDAKTTEDIITFFIFPTFNPTWVYEYKNSKGEVKQYNIIKIEKKAWENRLVLCVLVGTTSPQMALNFDQLKRVS